jgi:DNA-3-methyladenine glycosylase II
VYLLLKFHILKVYPGILNSNIDLDNIKNQTNEEVLKTLTSVKGIGKWTAEMFLIFSLGRLNIIVP